MGEALHIRSERVNLGKHQTRINVVWDLAPHDLSIITYLLGRSPTHVRAIGRCHVNPNIADIASLTLEFEDNLMASIILSWLDPRKSREMTIIGSKKMLVLDDTAATEKIRIYDTGVYGPDEYRSFGEFQVSYRYGDMVSPLLENYEPLRQQSEHFIECIRLGKQPRSDAASGIRVVRSLAAAQLSLDEGGSRVSVDDPRVLDVEGTIDHDRHAP
jgi:predicted dehydrogenase